MTAREAESTAKQVLEQLQVSVLRCYQIQADTRKIKALQIDEAAAAWQSKESDLWIDIETSDTKELTQLVAHLQLHPLIIEDCLDPHRSSRFSSYAESLHFEVPVFTPENDDQYLSVICVPQLTITIRTSAIAEIDALTTDLQTQTELNTASKSALLYAVLDALGNRLVVAASKSRDVIRDLSRTMDSQPTAVKQAEIIIARRRVQDICTIAEDQLYCVGALSQVDTVAFPASDQGDYLRDAVRSFEAAIRVLHRYESRALELSQQFQSAIQSRTDSRLRTLTILSSICMPLTLIAGVYGMNFSRMPELNAPWGYPVTLVVMALIAIGQLWFFYRKGWFR